MIEAANLSREILKAFPVKEVKEIMKEEEDLIKEWNVQEEMNTDNTSNLPKKMNLISHTRQELFPIKLRHIADGVKMAIRESSRWQPEQAKR